jgi:hypothetical protein
MDTVSRSPACSVVPIDYCHKQPDARSNQHKKCTSAQICTDLHRRVFHPTPPFATLLGFHLLIFSHIHLETVDDRYGYGTFLSPNCSILSLRCTCLIFQFLWRVFLCHCSLLENAHPCASQPCKEQQWRNKLLPSCL